MVLLIYSVHLFFAFLCFVLNQRDSCYQVIACAIIALLIDLLPFCLDGHILFIKQHCS